MPRFFFILVASFQLGLSTEWVMALEPARPPLSHPPLRKAPPANQRALEKGPVYFVDAAKGDDKNNGEKDKPWRTIRHALSLVKAGDTLYLRDGTYPENVRMSLMGRKEAPITIASYPGETAVIDGGMREFFEKPAECWEPFAHGGAGEYRSKQRYPNIRQIVGSFGDSMIGLHIYYHAKDLRATNEFAEQEPDKSDVKPIYCGPGLWYDRQSGYIHARFAPTHLPDGDNYRGETDPRKLPLIIAPFRSIPLHVDEAQHIRFHDLIIRGGGHDTIVLDQANDITFDNTTIWCGTYGLRITGTRRLNILRCGVYGNAPPWATRFDAGFNSYPGRSTRDITRLHTHALLVARGNAEFDVYAFPFNDDWEIAYSEFTDSGADGLYLGGVNVKFHHNLVDNMRDDGIYLSQMYPRHVYLRNGARIEIYQNIFSRCLTFFAYGGFEATRDSIYLYRNIVDMRGRVAHTRPISKESKLAPYMGHLTGDHGSPPWPTIYAYHNTFIAGSPSRTSHMAMMGASTAERPRRVFNNIFLHCSPIPNLQVPEEASLQADGNLYWQVDMDAKRASTYFAAYRAGMPFKNSMKVYPAGLEAHGLATDPQFEKFAISESVANDYRLRRGSPAIKAGVELPSEWPDPLRKQDKGMPDIGALPSGAEQIKVGRGTP